ncbi:GTP-binding protein [Pisolithus orientalis]|uniref:GTP-binding protein n=1 Tax=Pisolithus orientalis TaxID=936130 RepID=UPI00222573C2|nr:GTP-binding protein [Pisolithus orientalis]KAI6028889.1 GTP-binding protein [Pisolithus orientalis]
MQMIMFLHQLLLILLFLHLLEPPVQVLLHPLREEHVNHIDRFCIFVMGRANAGKTTILQRLCNSMDQPEIFDGNGRKHGDHRIEYELAFKSDPHYVFHDSCGFEAGSEEQFNMKKFVIDHANMPKLEKWIHAIWFCILLSEGHRMITIAERNFFDECDTGHVPVIVLLMKAGTLEVEAIQEMEEQQLGVNEEIAAIEQRMLDENLVKVKRWLNELRFPPHDFLPLRGKCSTIAMIWMQQEGADCIDLLKCTVNALKEESLQMLLISTQQSSIALCIEFAIKS